MRNRQLAPHMRLLGLLIICSSLIMGLILSASGVAEVNVKSPLAVQISHSLESIPESVQAGSYGTSNSAPHSSTSTFPVSTQVPPYNSPAMHSPAMPLYSSSDIDPLIEAPADEARPQGSRLVSLWMIIGGICMFGFLLWMTPMPKPASTSTRRYRR